MTERPSNRIPAQTLLLLSQLLPAAGIVNAQVLSWEANSLPTEGGWNELQRFCNPESWAAEGRYHQQLSMDACAGGSGGAIDSFRNELTEFVGSPTFHVEWRVETDGERSEIPGGAPTTMALANSFGIGYAIFVAEDQAKLNRDNLLPIIFAEFDSGVPHIHRLELFGPDLYVWYIDGKIVDSGKPEGAFPARNAFITWRGRSWRLPCFNRWDYIRYGTIPENGGGDFDSDGDHDLRDYYFFFECLNTNIRPVMPDGTVDPGCLWADTNADTKTDVLDFANFQSAFTGSE